MDGREPGRGVVSETRTVDRTGGGGWEKTTREKEVNGNEKKESAPAIGAEQRSLCSV